MRCPSCKNKILQKVGDESRLRITGSLRFLPDGSAQSKCHWCKADVTVPVVLDYPEDDIQTERFVVRSGT